MRHEVAFTQTEGNSVRVDHRADHADRAEGVPVVRAKNLRVLYVDTERVWRGGQEQLFTLMLGIKDRQHQACLAAPVDSPLSARAREKGIEIFPFRQRNEFSPGAVLKLWNFLRNREFDIVYVNTPRAIFSAGLASKLCGVPLRICSRRVNFPLRSRLSHLKYNWLQNRVITVSVSIRKTLIEGGVRPELIQVIYEGVDLDWIDGCQSSSVLDLGERLKVGTVAHLSAEKGHRVLLEAVARIVPKLPEVVFVLVGKGELMPQLQEQSRELDIEDHVLFTGFRDDSEALMKECDIFCLPSLSEGFSSAILVAMASSLPVIATQVGGIPELVIDGETGFLVPPNNASQLAEALSQVLESESLRRRLGQAGRQRVERNFMLQRKPDQTEQLYLTLLASEGIG
ncbi:MAG: glycosyltransferase family 4 protein [Acidobacteria bacterium]|nr:glycosyltransferase family 4 protein [Acidobacteriota bacterium]